MKTVKVCDLSGKALNWCVARLEGANSNIAPTAENPRKFFTFAPEYSSDWSQGGPIIGREEISIEFGRAEYLDDWIAYKLGLPYEDNPESGSSPLIAAMRCYVASKLGDEVEVPERIAC